MIAGRGDRLGLVAAFLAVTALAGCAQPGQTKVAGAQAAAHKVCSDGTTTISGGFEGAAFARCEVVGPDHFRLTIVPEDVKVTNCSAWYAFRVDASQSRKVEIKLNYGKCGHRYRPKVRTASTSWTVLPAEAVKLDFSKRRTDYEGKAVADATILLSLQPGATAVAGQPSLLPGDYAAWLDRLAKSPDVTRSLLGHSLQGRPIEMVTIHEPGSAPSRQVVLTGRQHPPETTGAIAMQAFTERLLEGDQLARTYRARYSTSVVPLLNPDGVVHGNWRHNMGQTDLNRDWGPFAQPETRLMRDLLARLNGSAGQRLRLFVDFHSTHYDTVYTLSSDQVTDPAGFTEKWMAAYQALLPDQKIRVQPGYNAKLPTAKTWVYQTYRVPTATYEIGDETDPVQIRRNARAAAEAMMATLLASDD